MFDLEKDLVIYKSSRYDHFSEIFRNKNLEVANVKGVKCFKLKPGKDELLSTSHEGKYFLFNYKLEMYLDFKIMLVFSGNVEIFLTSDFKEALTDSKGNWFDYNFFVDENGLIDISIDEFELSKHYGIYEEVFVIIPEKALENRLSNFEPKKIMKKHFFTEGYQLFNNIGPYLKGDSFAQHTKDTIVKYVMEGEIEASEIAKKDFMGNDYGIRRVEDAEELNKLIAKIHLIFVYANLSNFDTSEDSIEFVSGIRFKSEELIFETLKKMEKICQKNDFAITESEKILKEIDNILWKNIFREIERSGELKDLYDVLLRDIKLFRRWGKNSIFGK